MGLVSYTGGFATHCCYQIDSAAVDEVIEDIESGLPLDTLEVILQSPGGGVLAGLALYDYLRWLRQRGIHITTSALGLTASIGAIILQAGDHRVIGAESYLLIHGAQDLSESDDSEITGESRLIELVHRQTIRILSDRSHLTPAELETRMDGDWWLTASQALAHGLVDEVR